MKKILVVCAVLMTMVFATVASAEMKVRASASPQFGYITKFEVPAGSDLRKSNFVLDADASLELWKGLGFGTGFVFMPGNFDVAGIKGDLNVIGLTAGPRYYFTLSDSWELFGYANFGWYRSEAEAAGLSNTENTWGLNGGVGVNYLYKKMTVGMKGGTHYIKEVADNDDMMVWTVGPTLGVKF